MPGEILTLGSAVVKINTAKEVVMIPADAQMAVLSLSCMRI